MTASTAKNLPVSIEEEMRRELEALKGRLGALPTNSIKADNKLFTLPNGESAPALQVIVLDFIWALVHYPGKWNPAKPQAPDCWAFGRDKPESGLLVPSGSVKEPYGENCAVCPKNQWKSGDGNAKACRNQRRLLVVGANPAEESTVLTLYVKPASLKNFDAYVSKLAAGQGINPIQAVTEVSFDPNVSFNKLQFSFVERNAFVETAWALRQQGQPQLWRDIEAREEAA